LYSLILYSETGLSQEPACPKIPFFGELFDALISGLPSFGLSFLCEGRLVLTHWLYHSTSANSLNYSTSRHHNHQTAAL
jgi:hypothetical protein